jgi:histidinol phosphatase-like PHP family hydrolase
MGRRADGATRQHEPERLAGRPGRTNALVASLLRDLSDVQTAPASKWGYRRAASAILALEEPLERLVEPDGTLSRIKHIGPSSSRIIFEVLRTGRSDTVDRAVEASPRARDVEQRRKWRTDFLTRAEVVDVLEARGHSLVCQGDLQMHSEWSDGRDTLEAMAAACLARGYSYCAMTDHSRGLPIARGLAMADLARQHLAIDDLNRRQAGRFRMLKGIEANIRPDGGLDLSPDELSAVELVVASPHSALRKAFDQTERLVTAVTTRGVHVLGHPRGRMYGSRPGIVADWGRVFEAAARSRVAIEIDGDPARQDLDHTLARLAVDAGCLLAVDSDAHTTAQLSFIETARAHAILAGVPVSQVVNTWPLETLVEWAVRRSES